MTRVIPTLKYIFKLWTLSQQQKRVRLYSIILFVNRHAVCPISRAKYSDSVPDAALYYKSWSGFHDELLWAAAWLYKATNDSTYLGMARKMYGVMGGKNFIATEFSWDQKMPGAQVCERFLAFESRFNSYPTKEWHNFKPILYRVAIAL